MSSFLFFIYCFIFKKDPGKREKLKIKEPEGNSEGIGLHRYKRMGSKALVEGGAAFILEERKRG